MRVVLTGAAGGIGRRVARRLVEQGHTVVGIDRRAVVLDGVETHVLDLTDGEAVRDLLAGQPVDALVTAAGWYEVSAIEECSPETFRRHLESNLVAVHTVVHAVLPTLRRRQGRVVVVGSSTGSVALPFHGAYSTAKAGLHGYTDSLRREVEPRGVDVALVEPGPTRTGLNESAARGADDDGAYAETHERFRGYSPRVSPPSRSPRPFSRQPRPTARGHGTGSEGAHAGSPDWPRWCPPACSTVSSVPVSPAGCSADSSTGDHSRRTPSVTAAEPRGAETTDPGERSTADPGDYHRPPPT